MYAENRLLQTDEGQGNAAASEKRAVFEIDYVRR